MATIEQYCKPCDYEAIDPDAQYCPLCGRIPTLMMNTVLQGNTNTYTLVDVLGVGGFGKVYLAVDQNGEKVVIKQAYSEDPADFMEVLRRFDREAQALLAMTHPAPFPICYERFQFDGLECMVMEYIEGQDLEQMILAQGPLQPDRVLQIAIAVCDALERMHASGFVHRDIKPANVIETPKAEIKLLDFGLARLSTLSAATQA